MNELKFCTNCLNDILDGEFIELNSSIEPFKDIVCRECLDEIIEEQKIKNV